MNVSDLRMTLQVPDDIPQGPGNFYYVLLSVWDSAGSYDQIGLANAFGVWGIAYSTTSYCGGTYYYSPEAFVLQRGVTYLFEMSIASGVVTFSVSPVGSSSTLWTLAAKTGGSAFHLGELYSCDSTTYYDYTDYEEVYYTSGPRVPYDLFFTNNSADHNPVTTWSLSLPNGAPVATTGTNVTVENEPFFLAFPSGVDSTAFGSAAGAALHAWNVTVGDLTPDAPVSVSTYHVPAGWNLSLQPSSGAPPFTSELNYSFPPATSPGVYSIGLNASDSSGSGAYERLTLRISIGAEYTVTFPESGLPSGSPFSVAVGDRVVTASSTFARVQAPNGTYPYWIGDVQGYRQATLPYSGNLTVAGTGVSEPTAMFTEDTYAVRFAESGLPAGVDWGVTLNGTQRSVTTNGGTDNVTFLAPNGTYSYSLSAVAGWSESSLAANGSVSVWGLPISEPTEVYRAIYSVVFSERGLPSGTAWQATLNGVTKSLTVDGGTDDLTFQEMNGTLAYSIASVVGWRESTLAPSGNLVVNGAPVLEPTLVYFEVFPVTFSERGLPAGLHWQVAVNGAPMALTTDGATDQLTFEEPNGSFTYSIAGLSGWVQSTLAASGSGRVTGAPATLPTLVYTQVIYPIVFSEAGLPTGLLWAVTLNGVRMSLTTAAGSGNLTFQEPNGTFAYSIGEVAGWSQPTLPALGHVIVTGTPLTEPTLQYGVTQYANEFTESGLSYGTPWQVNIGNGSVSTSGSVNTFWLPNGSYTYTVSKVPGYLLSPQSGSFSVNGAPVDIAITFSEPTYSVTFDESGLPSGAQWSEGLYHIQPYNPYEYFNSSRGPSITLPNEPNGSDGFDIVAPSGYVPEPVSGVFHVLGSSVVIPIAFLPGNTLEFTETNLFGISSWNVTVAGVTRTSTGPSIAFPEPNGSFEYEIGPIPGWIATPSNGTVVVSGAPIYVAVNFTAIEYSVTFTETGLPLGTQWYVTGFDPEFPSNSTGSSIVIPAIDGIYNYGILPVAGLVPTPANGSVTVFGSSATVGVRFTLPTYPVTFVESGLSVGTQWTVILGNSSAATGNATLRFYEPNGTWAYSIPAVSGYTIGHSKGNVTVDGLMAWVFPVFTPVNYTITFVESNLPLGKGWSVVWDGTLRSTTGASIAFSGPDGTHAYLIVGPAGERVAGMAASGTLTLAGAATTVSVAFQKGATYAISFSRAGLTLGEQWSVALAGWSVFSGRSGIRFGNLTPGNYEYAVGPMQGQKISAKVSGLPAPLNGTLSVGGRSLLVALRYVYPFNVTLNETGLPAGTNWSVSIRGIVERSSTRSIEFSEPNGSYLYAVAPESGYTYTKSPGSIRVAGGASSASVTFRAKGTLLPAPTDWGSKPFGLRTSPSARGAPAAVAGVGVGLGLMTQVASMRRSASSRREVASQAAAFQQSGDRPARGSKPDDARAEVA